MAAPTFDENVPDIDNAHDEDYDQIRDNWVWLIAQLILNDSEVLGWATTPSGSDLSKPDYVEAVHSDGRKVKVSFTYTDDDVTGIVVQFDKNLGAGYETFVKGTGTIGFNGSGEWTGTSWA